MITTIISYAALLFGLFLFGIPVGYAIALTSLILFFITTGGTADPAIILQRMFDGADNFTLLAVPIFILTGNLMNTAGITRRLFNFASALVGHFRLGLAQVNIVVSMIFSGMSGSATVDVAAIGQVEMKAMLDAKYDRNYSAAVTAASATVGPIVPPSIPLVIFGIVAQASVARLLVGGIIPGIIMCFMLMSLVAIQARFKVHKKEKFVGFRKLWDAFRKAFFPSLTPIVLLGGILSGIFTPTEAAVIALAYSMILGLLVYREIGLKQFFKIVKDSMRWTAEVMIIIASANAFSYIVISAQIPQALVQMVSGLIIDKWLILLIINLSLLIIGCFLGPVPAITITAPILMPLIHHLGISPIHFGLIMVMNLVLGLLTPPVGLVLFVTSRVAQIHLGQLLRPLLPFYIPLLLTLVLITYVPSIVTFLPNFLIGK